MTDKTTIEERENGPLVVTNLRSFRDADGTDIPCKTAMFLCRCGQSANKPFCDGSHRSAEFESRGGTPAGPDRIIAYEGSRVTVDYNPMLCAHAAECVRLAGAVFDPDRKPWVQPDNAEDEVVWSAVAACPSGALTITGKHGPEQLMESGRPQIQVQKNGPYWVHDIDPPVTPTGQQASARKYVLCRCGKSGNKPFCDGSHRDAGWTDD